ncbi:MAG: TadE/TadG family type IV pilus assembly protein [Nitrospirales bacterium]|nr:pilus assembly protein [Nitrospirales bacterium]
MMSLHTIPACCNERGTALLELSISIMLFLFMTFGIIEYGSMINERNALTQLAREGASIASRNLTSNQNMLDLLESTDNALKFSTNPNKYRIFLAQITAGTAGNPTPTCALVQRGGLTNGVQAPAPPSCDLPANLVTYLTYNAGLGTAPVKQFTVVKVYYEHDPITPFGNLDWYGGGGTGNAPTVFMSEAIF